ncbi:MAG: sigma-70 family RNA polymerase sigma factor [Tenuifilaceae bacterium]|jgi:RNA polymerase sigma-70 factor (ECF subfamily)|nr:sigma-70 family RNA polymerase sigma factor [Bacteroidales bacterium]MDI9516245.1 sigma-70 family RNA polymerase sigma factor [Bacteroidota bacterium]NLH55555.1 sigma-70 family RNA polymerase sigma factor [Rikenellaceae bacterium]OQC64947.1 MAG: ECF RNA polymerase sigma factor SigW [Bacteroidetes bacterium ADurb.Bin008]HNV80429.1 sigma-70 family RNA polymerase sigma factor [Tenuifilaceae bacterium]
MEINQNLSDKAKADLVLVDLAIKGDQRAYAELLERYRDAIYFMLLKMVNNKSDAEDLTIEAFGKAFKSIHQYTPNFAFSTWLFKIATNNCIDFIRKKKGNLVSIDQVPEDLEGGSSAPASNLQASTLDPEEFMIKEQSIKLIQTLVSKLKPRYRNLIELRYFREYSYEEIAEELSLPLGTVKAQLFRARELLSNILKNSTHSH